MSETPFIIKGPDGKPVFLGAEDPQNPPVNPKPGEGSKMTCPVCRDQVDYLLGEDEGNGKMGCETCYRPNTQRRGKGGQYERPTRENEKDVFER
jgi:hypothetical protein